MPRWEACARSVRWRCGLMEKRVGGVGVLRFNVVRISLAREDKLSSELPV